MVRVFSSGLLASALIAMTSMQSAQAYTGLELAKDARVTLAAAKAIALKARPGRVTDRELEHERGGSGLRYSFDISSQGVVYEVGVDATTGRVLENAPEGAHPD